MTISASLRSGLPLKVPEGSDLELKIEQLTASVLLAAM